MGLFDAPPPTPYKSALPDPLSMQTGTVERRARSYLHANCGFCHRPAEGAASPIDLRYDVAFKDTNTCGATPEKGDQGVPGALVIAPGQPRNSVLVLRMLAAPEDMNGKHGRMPKIASYVVDTEAVPLIENWITSVTACPQ